ncbi:DUF6804 family protein [Mucilaginibacter sp.]|jgi:hypothetical protein|uniref:DUF6804 family protein n=1 Tax=Mucilaginibacter sp. TaxID=1882438 RepID=UPI002C9E4532|nr:DUF6804 family protein [Mucilaginibacter sp.]HTI60761.1 DUF6804 family protein [Mucilaginibacter sp.]
MKFLYPTFIKLVMVASLMVAAQDDIPHWYYIVFRLGMCTCCGLIIYILYGYSGDRSLGIGGTLMILILFNPILKPRYTREDWAMVDWIMAAIISLWMIYDIFLFIKRRIALSKAKKELKDLLMTRREA